MLKKLTDNYAELATFTESSLGEPMGIAWAKVGDQSATAMITQARETIKELETSFAKFVQKRISKKNRQNPVTIYYRYEQVGPSPQGIDGTSVVRSIQNYEQRNGSRWRERIR